MIEYNLEGIEGYFPIRVYCELAKVSKDTAYHRTSRKTVPFFVDEYGKMYIYYSTGQNVTVPDNFVTLKEYAKVHNLKFGTLRQLINRGNVKQEDIFRITHIGGGRSSVYIRKNAVINYKIIYGKTAELYDNKPSGYLTIKEWSEKNNIGYSAARAMVYYKKIPIKRVGANIYIRDDVPVPPRKKERFPRNTIIKHRPDGYFTVREFADLYGVSIWTIRGRIRHQLIPFIKVGKYYYIPSDYEYVKGKAGRKKNG